MTPWEQFERMSLEKIFQPGKKIIDIGGGLRLSRENNNRLSDRNQWVQPLLAQVDYKVMDKVADYHPDIVGDIHHLPFADNTIDSIICIAVLEHVEEPWIAAQEMHRVLKTDGTAFVYVPFLYYYHPLKGYYGDFYRYTEEGIGYLFRNFSSLDLSPVRGATETVFNLLPKKISRWIWPSARIIDRLMGKSTSHQTSGFNIFLTK